MESKAACSRLCTILFQRRAAKARLPPALPRCACLHPSRAPFFSVMDGSKKERCVAVFPPNGAAARATVASRPAHDFEFRKFARTRSIAKAYCLPSSMEQWLSGLPQWSEWAMVVIPFARASCIFSWKVLLPVGKHGVGMAINQLDGHNVPFGTGYFYAMPLVAMRMASSWLSVTVNKSMSDSADHVLISRGPLIHLTSLANIRYRTARWACSRFYAFAPAPVPEHLVKACRSLQGRRLRPKSTSRHGLADEEIAELDSEIYPIVGGFFEGELNEKKAH